MDNTRSRAAGWALPRRAWLPTALFRRVALGMVVEVVEFTRTPEVELWRLNFRLDPWAPTAVA